MVTLNRDGANFRTKLMDHEAAHRFAKCLAGNPRFTGAYVSESPTAKGAKRHFVVYQPANESRQAGMLRDQQDQRLVRAATQASNYSFILDDSRRYFHCLNVASGEVYETTERSCNCPDHTYRSGPAGLQCKHILALVHDLSPVQGWSQG